jgi:hypothetical protein
MNCTTCGTEIKRPPSHLKYKKVFCNHKCYAEHKSKNWIGKENPRWGGGEDKLNCLSCGKEYIRKKYGKKENKFCSIKCASKERGDLNSGQNHWNWKGGNNSRYLKKVSPRPKPDKCEVCGGQGGKRNGIVLDHNHKTGDFRGWLCSNCNTALGLLKDNVKRIEALKQYLTNNENLL